MIEEDKLKPCLICDNTGFKISRDIETDKLVEMLCECPWGDITRSYFNMALVDESEAKNNDYHKRCGARRIS